MCQGTTVRADDRGDGVAEGGPRVEQLYGPKSTRLRGGRHLGRDVRPPCDAHTVVRPARGVLFEPSTTGCAVDFG